jgi:hypothetical protein
MRVSLEFTVDLLRWPSRVTLAQTEQAGGSRIEIVRGTFARRIFAGRKA